MYAERNAKHPLKKRAHSPLFVYRLVGYELFLRTQFVVQDAPLLLSCTQVGGRASVGDSDAVETLFSLLGNEAAGHDALDGGT